MIAGELIDADSFQSRTGVGWNVAGTAHPTAGVDRGGRGPGGHLRGSLNVVPAIQAARTSAVRALARPAPPRGAGAWLIALSARVPTALLLGLRIAARRIRRTVLTGARLLIAVAMVVAAIAVHQNIHIAERQPGPVNSPPATASTNRPITS